LAGGRHVLGESMIDLPTAEWIKAFGHNQYPVQTIACRDNCMLVPRSNLCSGVLDWPLHLHAQGKMRLIIDSEQIILFCTAFDVCCAFAL
jgi:hypothetical protein